MERDEYILVSNKSERDWLAANGVYPVINIDYYRNTRQLRRLMYRWNCRTAGFGSGWAKWIVS